MSTTIKKNSSVAMNIAVLREECQVNEILRTIALRWKMQILYCVSKGTDQFSKIKELFPDLSDQVLGKRLSELVAEKILIKQELITEIPVQIKYKPTIKGKELLDIVSLLHKWGARWEQNGST